MKCYVTWGSRKLVVNANGPFDACMRTFKYFLGTREANADTAATMMRVSECGFVRRNTDSRYKLEDIINTILLENSLHENVD